MLEELDLSWNHLRQRGAIGIARGIEVMLTKNTSQVLVLIPYTLICVMSLFKLSAQLNTW